MERPSLTGDCAWQASFPAEERPYSSRFTFKERYVFHPPFLSLSLSSLLGRRCNTCVHLPSYLANFLFHPYFMANLINGCAVDDYCAGILLGTDPSTLSLVAETEREKRGKMAFLVHNLIIAVQKNLEINTSLDMLVVFSFFFLFLRQ